jgi:phage terminase small subunit
MARNGTIPELNPKQERFLVALFETKTVADAAGKSGVGLRSAWRWLREPQFRKALREHRQEAVSQSTGRLISATGEAVEALRAVLSDPETPPGTKVQAAKAILETALKAAELDDLAGRVEELEKAQKDLDAVDPQDAGRNGKRW